MKSITISGEFGRVLITHFITYYPHGVETELVWTYLN